MTLPPDWSARNEKAEVAWRWALRILALIAFGYVLIGLDGNAPVGVFILIGGFAGVGNVVPWASVAETFIKKGGEK